MSSPFITNQAGSTNNSNPNRPPPSSSSSTKIINNYYADTCLDPLAVDKYFEKKFKFTKKPEWQLPTNSNEMFKHHLSSTTNSNGEKIDRYQKLHEIKLQLNNVKDKLNEFPLHVWSKHTQKLDPAGGVRWSLRQDINAEFITKAWCKFYECLNAYPLVNTTNNNDQKLMQTKLFNSIHLCEAPGAFVAALNHYLKLNFDKVKVPLKWDWCATTLNPYYEGNTLSSTVLDDRLILHSFDKWEFGDDFTGDITKNSTYVALQRRAKRMGNINLITADGSIDCTDAPQDQEDIVSFLHYAEVLAGLQLLDYGGNFVIKMFTFFEQLTIDLLYLLNNCFLAVHVFKPATSKHGNSEVYVIALGYQKSTHIIEILDAMRLKMSKTNEIHSMFAESLIPNDFIDQVCECAKLFMEYQVEAIQMNIHTFEGKRSRLVLERKRFISEKSSDVPTDNSVLSSSAPSSSFLSATSPSLTPKYNIQDVRLALKKKFFRIYAIDLIDSNQKLVKEIDPLPHNMNIRVFSYNGSFTDRKLFTAFSHQQKTQTLIDDLKTLERSIVLLSRIDYAVQLPMANNDGGDEDENKIEILYGKSIKTVVSSKFILLQCIKLLLDIFRYCSPPKSSDNRGSIDDVLTIKSSGQNNTNHFEALVKVNIKIYSQIKSYDKFEKKFFNSIFDLIRKCPNDMSAIIYIENYLLLTHFSVGVIYILGQYVFKEVFLNNLGKIICKKLRPNGKRYLRNFIMEIDEKINDDDDIDDELSVVNVVTIANLREEQFYSAILTYNNNLCLKYCHVMLDN